MKSLSKIFPQINRLATICAAAAISLAAYADSIPVSPWKNLTWKVGAELSGGYVPGTNAYLKGMNSLEKKIDTSFSGGIRGAFSLNPYSAEGMAYRGLYQGIGIDARSFLSESLLGTPWSVYAFQGAPIVNITPRLSLDYEWKFGAAFGWKHYYGKYDFGYDNSDNTAVSTPVTAHMALGLKFRYALSTVVKLSAGIEATHFSNGNTSYPNGGVNTLGLAVGIEYRLTGPTETPTPDTAISELADRKRMMYDITLFGGWRKRGMDLDGTPFLCSGKFGVAGVQLAALRKFQRWFAAGASLDMMYDESAGLARYRAEDTYGDNTKFYRPPFGKQLSVGLSAHAQLTAPIFTIDAGIGFDMLKPDGDKRFYQSLTLKTFLTDWLYLNVGYRLGDFKDPQNLMLGFGVRL